MCGIAGIVGPGAANRSRIDSMLDVIQHRGPDDEGVYAGDGVILGHRRLSIIDLTGGHQPISSQDKTTWMVFNGEIYNYASERRELEKQQRQFATSSDSEVIVQLYEEHGKNCVNHLRGMFAFSIWDERKRTLFAARDHLGQKPFFYAVIDGTLLFASEIKALLAAEPSLKELDPEALDQYFTLRVIASPRTMFRRIRKLPPGHSLSFSEANGLEIRRYWDLNFEPKFTDNENQLVDRLEHEVIESLRHHLVSDVPVGAFMSGGIDSTLVVSMLMQHVSKEPLHTFSVGLPYKQFDEAPYAKLIAEKYKTIHHEKIVRPSLVDTLPKLVWHLDEPSDPLSICTYLIAEMAREHVKVVVGGDGGDELFGGYDRYYGNRYADMYAKIPAFLRKNLIGPGLSLMPDGGWYKSKAHQAKWLHRLSFLQGGARYAASLSYFYFRPEQRAELYGSWMLDRTASMDPEASIREPFDRAQANNIIDRMLYADDQVRLPDHPVMILDRMTMAHSLEARSPFMDHKLAEFSARIPWQLKVKGRSLRYIQMRLAERYLPDDVLKRPKQGFSSALPYMLRGEYEHLYNVMLRNMQLSQDDIVRQDMVNALIAEHSAGKADHGNRLWLLINAEVWYRMFILGMSKEELSAEIAGPSTATSAVSNARATDPPSEAYGK